MISIQGDTCEKGNISKHCGPWASLLAQMVKHLPAMQETQIRPLGWEDPWSWKWQPTPVFLPGELHGQWSLVGSMELQSQT